MPRCRAGPRQRGSGCARRTQSAGVSWLFRTARRLPNRRVAIAVRPGSMRMHPSSWVQSRRRTTSRWSSCRRCSQGAEYRSVLARCGGSSTGTGLPAKKTAHATEQDSPDVLKRREEWLDGQLDLDTERLVFIDETWASTNMARLHGRCRRGERLRSSAYLMDTGRPPPSSLGCAAPAWCVRNKNQITASGQLPPASVQFTP